MDSISMRGVAEYPPTSSFSCYNQYFPHYNWKETEESGKQLYKESRERTEKQKYVDKWVNVQYCSMEKAMHSVGYDVPIHVSADGTRKCLWCFFTHWLNVLSLSKPGISRTLWIKIKVIVHIFWPIYFHVNLDDNAAQSGYTHRKTPLDVIYFNKL